MESLRPWLRGLAKSSADSHPAMAQDSSSQAEISKKELLRTTGLSYGQLYRWKRQGLIPEHWFMKRATFTGQETFFPREQILKRIETILSLRDRYSLEEIARLLSPTSPMQRYSRSRLATMGILSDAGLDAVDAVRETKSQTYGDTDPMPCPSPEYSFFDLLAAAVADHLAEIGLPDCIPPAVATLLAGVGRFERFDSLHLVCALARDSSHPFALIYAGTEPVVFGEGVKVLVDLALGPLAETLRQQLQPDLM